jgi:predicted RNA binding protein YcfA (HicA-like mRNA interferase family)
MPSIPGVNHRRAIRALQRTGFRVVREGRKHVVMSDGARFVTIPRNDPINAYTMGGIVTDAGLSVEEFKALL